MWVHYTTRLMLAGLMHVTVRLMSQIGYATRSWILSTICRCRWCVQVFRLGFTAAKNRYNHEERQRCCCWQSCTSGINGGSSQGQSTDFSIFNAAHLTVTSQAFVASKYLDALFSFSFNDFGIDKDQGYTMWIQAFYATSSA